MFARLPENASPLRQCLNTAIDTYINSMLSNKRRAREYKLSLIHVSDSILAEQVLFDIRDMSGDGRLGLSKRLRVRLTQALCEYFQISSDEINKKASSFAYAVTIHGHSIALAALARKESTYDLIAARIGGTENAVEMKEGLRH